MALSSVSGAMGMLLRRTFWPRLFASCGKVALFGRNIVLRHPNRISLGNRVVISDGCVLDGRNPTLPVAISLGDDTILSNYVIITCKYGKVTIGDRFGCGAQSIISAADDPVVIGADVLIGARCFISSSGNYIAPDPSRTIRSQGRKSRGGCTLEDDIWLGANVTVLAGVTMGSGSMAGAGAVVTKSMPKLAICVGVPARVVKMRGASDTDRQGYVNTAESSPVLRFSSDI